MASKNKLYTSYQNPYLIRSSRPLPDEMAVIGAGNIGPDIAYYLRTGLPNKKLFLVKPRSEIHFKDNEPHRELKESLVAVSGPAATFFVGVFQCPDGVWRNT